jgi:hypothetical protein
VSIRRKDPLKLKKNCGNNVAFRLLDYKYRVVFKLKRTEKMLIDG